jgi:hypothetical protein
VVDDVNNLIAREYCIIHGLWRSMDWLVTIFLFFIFLRVYKYLELFLKFYSAFVF